MPLNISYKIEPISYNNKGLVARGSYKFAKDSSPLLSI